MNWFYYLCFSILGISGLYVIRNGLNLAPLLDNAMYLNYLYNENKKNFEVMVDIMINGQEEVNSKIRLTHKLIDNHPEHIILKNQDKFYESIEDAKQDHYVGFYMKDVDQQFLIKHNNRELKEIEEILNESHKRYMETHMDVEQTFNRVISKEIIDVNDKHYDATDIGKMLLGPNGNYFKDFGIKMTVGELVRIYEILENEGKSIEFKELKVLDINCNEISFTDKEMELSL